MSNRKVYLRRVAKFVGACLLIVALGTGYVYYLRHFITQNIDDFYGYSDELKEQYFSEIFPSRQEIEDYLLDTTILTSEPPIGNDVTYFDKQRNYFDWHGNEIKKGILVPISDGRLAYL